MIFNKCIEKLSSSFGHAISHATPHRIERSVSHSPPPTRYNGSRNLEYEKAMAASYAQHGATSGQQMASKKKKPNKVHKNFLTSDELALIIKGNNNNNCNNHSNKNSNINNNNNNNNNVNYLRVPHSTQANAKDIPALRIRAATASHSFDDCAYRGYSSRSISPTPSPSPASSYTHSLSTESLAAASASASASASPSSSAASTPTSLSASPPRFYCRRSSLRLQHELAVLRCKLWNFPWFHGNLSGKEAEKLILERGKIGSFLVRESQSKPGDFVVSVRMEEKVSHVIIRWQDKKYDVGGGEPFDTLSELIEHYKRNPMVEKCGTVVHLRHPFNATRITASGINARVEQLVKVGAYGQGGFWEEFESLQQDSRCDTFSRNEGYKPENRNKNRYRNILPYDHTRVKLMDVDHSVPGAEYINANYIRIPTDGDLNNMSSSSESLNASLVPSCPACTAAHTQKNCPNCQMLNKTCVQCAVKSAILPFSNCATCNKKSDTMNKHKRSDSTTSSGYSSAGGAGSNCRSAAAGGLLKKNSNELTERDMFKTYIATQGCLQHTTVDFWNMIWQENTRVIVMTTKEFERNRSKCAKYWPDEGQCKQFGPAKIQCISENKTNDYTLREFLFSWRDKPERRIFHYHFQVWPDHGVPSDPGCVLNFLQDVNTKQSQLAQAGEKPGPICVHCSAGIGRTGTFIVIDMILDQIVRHGLDTEIDIQRTIQILRSQRSGLVQTEAQYKFVYYAVQHYIQTLIQRKRAEEQSQQVGREYTNIKYTDEIGNDSQRSPLPPAVSSLSLASSNQTGGASVAGTAVTGVAGAAAMNADNIHQQQLHQQQQQQHHQQQHNSLATKKQAAPLPPTASNAATTSVNATTPKNNDNIHATAMQQQHQHQQQQQQQQQSQQAAAAAAAAYENIPKDMNVARHHHYAPPPTPPRNT